ncbi:hypothetical protein BC936DRAFT_146658 [Jimgerdemannia flammicorona]|uniref:Uncharacterized protein n=1 Tax=Jimgerdemannia flammicorona TaxID=994334 RepID=A0A433D717_9FUNG|nr:hypothetical protein BC936DRAFT_146658 [Jimgerdemannia flammicorona]
MRAVAELQAQVHAPRANHRRVEQLEVDAFLERVTIEHGQHGGERERLHEGRGKSAAGAARIFLFAAALANVSRTGDGTHYGLVEGVLRALLAAVEDLGLGVDVLEDDDAVLREAGEGREELRVGLDVLEIAEVEIAVQGCGNGVDEGSLASTRLAVEHDATAVGKADALVEVLVVLEGLEVAAKELFVLLLERDSLKPFNIHQGAGAAPVAVAIVLVARAADSALRFFVVQVALLAVGGNADGGQLLLLGAAVVAVAVGVAVLLLVVGLDTDEGDVELAAIVLDFDLLVGLWQHVENGRLAILVVNLKVGFERVTARFFLFGLFGDEPRQGLVVYVVHAVVPLVGGHGFDGDGDGALV